MGADRFKKFMESVEGLIIPDNEHQHTPDTYAGNEAQEDENAPQQPLSAINIEKPAGEPVQLTLFGDDDIIPVQQTKKPDVNGQEPADDLVSMGISFLGKLSETLSSPEKTRKLVNSVTEKNEKGEVYLNIPVVSEQMIENALRLFSSLVKGMKQV